jgi:hypothetical protein
MTVKVSAYRHRGTMGALSLRSQARYRIRPDSRVERSVLLMVSRLPATHYERAANRDHRGQLDWSPFARLLKVPTLAHQTVSHLREFEVLAARIAATCGPEPRGLEVELMLTELFIPASTTVGPSAATEFFEFLVVQSGEAGRVYVRLEFERGPVLAGKARWNKGFWTYSRAERGYHQVSQGQQSDTPPEWVAKRIRLEAALRPEIEAFAQACLHQV